MSGYTVMHYTVWKVLPNRIHEIKCKVLYGKRALHFFLVEVFLQKSNMELLKFENHVKLIIADFVIMSLFERGLGGCI